MEGAQRTVTSLVELLIEGSSGATLLADGSTFAIILLVGGGKRCRALSTSMGSPVDLGR